MIVVIKAALTMDGKTGICSIVIEMTLLRKPRQATTAIVLTKASHQHMSYFHP